MSPAPFRETLVFVAGSTPQIITETIQALVCQTPPIIPDCIRIITTVPGKQLILDKLVTGGILSALCREYEIPDITLENGNFLVLCDHQGREIDDLWTVEENEIAADQIVGFLREQVHAFRHDSEYFSSEDAREIITSSELVRNPFFLDSHCYADSESNARCARHRN